MEKSELLALLESYKIPLENWGVGEAKTINHLLSELNKEETALIEENGHLIRLCKGAAINIYYADGGTAWILKELRQVFKDGREKTRALDFSIGEKALPGETAEDTAHRALNEELGIKEKLRLIPRPTRAKGLVPSISFPGLITEYAISAFDVFLLSHLYRPEGYTETQEDKTTYFVWVKTQLPR